MTCMEVLPAIEPYIYLEAIYVTYSVNVLEKLQYFWLDTTSCRHCLVHPLLELLLGFLLNIYHLFNTYVYLLGEPCISIALLFTRSTITHDSLSIC